MIFLFLTYLLSPLIYPLFLFKKKRIDRILIIQTAKIGDFIYATCKLSRQTKYINFMNCDIKSCIPYLVFSFLIVIGIFIIFCTPFALNDIHNKQ